MKDHFSIIDDSPYPFEDFFVGRRSALNFLRRTFSGRSRIVIVEGLAGVGKTMLARYFIHKERDLFPGGVKYAYAYSFEVHLRDHLELSTHKKSLLVVDEAHNLSTRSITELKRLLDENPSLCLLLVCQTSMRFSDLGEMRNLQLKGFTKSDFVEFIKQRLRHLDPSVRDEFYNLVDGHPLATAIASSALTAGTITLSQLFAAFQDFEAPGIVGPDGTPYDPSLKLPKKLIVSVSEVNEELLALLKADPELLRKIPPRKFEEIIAELLSRQGYHVELTPATRDGGFDMYAAKSELVGSFLFLVECKRYTPPSKVGVRVVRSLYGVVQQTKATAGMIATTSFFTSAAKEFQSEVKHQISLQDFFEIKKWLGLL
jgi:restriction system protein